MRFMRKLLANQYPPPPTPEDVRSVVCTRKITIESYVIVRSVGYLSPLKWKCELKPSQAEIKLLRENTRLFPLPWNEDQVARFILARRVKELLLPWITADVADIVLSLVV